MSIIIQNGSFIFLLASLISLRMDIGGQLKKLRTRNKMSRAKLADMLTLSAQQLYKYEAGINNVPVHILAQIANIYGVSLDYFVQNTALEQHQRISFDEKEILEIYKQLSSAKKKLFLKIARQFLTRKAGSNYKNSRSKSNKK